MTDNYERAYSVADDLRKALEPGFAAPEGEPLSLNDVRLLDALSSTGTSKSTREVVAGILRSHWDHQGDDPVTHREENAG